MAAKGYDVSKLKADFLAWDQMIVKAATDYASFINLLQNAKQYTPYESAGQLSNAISQARAQLRIVRQDIIDVRHYYQTVIRPAIAALASQTPTTPATTNPSTAP
ncbi:MAG: hypothetical protein CVT63_05150 [Candidatus Anoxymicrobium japonicum]|uniref:Uncharacterized protein n=1 Tax=Candidatus Anoxymicrobium japonicum TaxID=2013648 RepID=A0A2N3G5K1_9ACTN|nr:MAG: hypothetical protein CVT63_05150 [Candidatus Anoxymicrobium japonicum]